MLGPPKAKGSGDWPEPFVTGTNLCLFQVVGDRLEGRLQLGAETLHDGDDGDRDASGDEAILDGGRSRFILHKTHNEAFHRVLLRGPHVAV